MLQIQAHNLRVPILDLAKCHQVTSRSHFGRTRVQENIILPTNDLELNFIRPIGTFFCKGNFSTEKPLELPKDYKSKAC